jgi:hypothetical protein
MKKQDDYRKWFAYGGQLFLEIVVCFVLVYGLFLLLS